MDLRFSLTWSPWIVVGITMAALGLAVFSYQKTSRPISNQTRTLLILLRSLTILVLIFAILAPVLTLSTKTKELPKLAVLIDTSESMSIEDEIIPDQEGPKSRFETARQIIENLLKGAGDKYRIEILGFSSSPSPFDPAKSSPQGKETRLYYSLKEVSNRPERGNPAGILLLSDGLETDKIDETRPPRGLPPVYTVGFGGARSVKDIKLTEVEANEPAYLNREFPIEVKIETSGYPGEEAWLILKEGKREVLKKAIRLKEGLEEYTIKITPKQEGRFQYTVSVSEKPGEITARNNYANFSLQVVKSKIRIFYYEGEPRWDYAFLKRFFDRTEDIEATCLLRNKEGGCYQPDSRQDNKKALTFPGRRSDLFAYDLIILGSFEPGFLTRDQKEAVVEFVSEHGGGLLFLAGLSGLHPGAELSPLLPIVPGEAKQGEPARISLTLEGRNHPITRLDPDPEINNRRWEELPYLEGITETGSVKPGAIVLANSRPDDQVFTAIQRYGRGRVMVITADSTWRWDIGPSGDQKTPEVLQTPGVSLDDQKQPNEVYVRFYQQAIRWLSTKAELKPVNVFTDRPVYQEEEKVEITATVYDQNYRPIEGAAISGEILTQGQEAIKIGLTGGQGRYTTKVVPPRPGKYKIKITAKKQEQVLGEAETDFIVEEKGVEFLRLDQNSHLLSSLSSLTGGNYFERKDRDKVLSKLSELKGSIKITTHQIELWDRWPTLFLFLILIGTEWILRKKYGLV
ncbi:MAG: hypothetical protein AB1797_13820 [bacterium]